MYFIPNLDYYENFISYNTKNKYSDLNVITYYIKYKNLCTHLCEYGKLNALKNVDKQLIKRCLTLCFVHSCINGHFKIAKWLFNNFNIKNYPYTIDNAFRESCTYGHLKIAKWLKKNQSFNNSIFQDSYMRSYSRGYFNIAKWIKKSKPMINYGFCDKLIFKYFFDNNKLSLAKRLYKINHRCIDKDEIKDLFLECCEKGYFDFLKWLYEIDNNVYHDAILKYNDKMFAYTTNQNIYDWLKQNYPKSIKRQKVFNKQIENLISNFISKKFRF